jgi:hypothetical protein
MKPYVVLRTGERYPYVPVQPPRTSIYGVVRKSDRLLLYVGYTRQPLGLRLRQHLNSARTFRTPWARWIRENPGTALDIIELERVAEGQDPEEVETKWISHLLGAGVDLKNDVVANGLDKAAFLRCPALAA